MESHQTIYIPSEVFAITELKAVSISILYIIIQFYILFAIYRNTLQINDFFPYDVIESKQKTVIYD